MFARLLSIAVRAKESLVLTFTAISRFLKRLATNNLILHECFTLEFLVTNVCDASTARICEKSATKAVVLVCDENIWTYIPSKLLE